MESQEGVFGSNISETDVRHNRDPFKSDEKEANAENVRVLSVDKVTVEKIVLESSDGSREVLLTKNESSRKLSLSSETRSNVVKCVKNERQKSENNDRFRENFLENISKSKDTIPKTIVSGSQSKLPIPKSRKNNGVSSREESRINPIKFTKTPSIDSIVIESLNSASTVVKKNKVSPRAPEKSITRNEHNSSLIATSVSSAKAKALEDLLSKGEKVVDKIVAEVKQEQAEQELFEAKDVAGDKEGDGINSAGIDKHNETSEATNVNCKCESDEIKKQDDVESREGDARIDRDVRDRLEKSQATIDDLQKNLSTKIHASTAQSYKEKLLGLQSNYVLKPPIILESNCNERLSSEFDKDFLERHNLDKRLKIEEKRLLETDLDYTSDNDRTSETDERPSSKIDVKRKYSAKVTEVEKRWSGDFLDNRLQRNSSESSKSSYIEEFDSVSSRESIVEDRDAQLLFDRKHPEAKFTERRTSIDESKRRTSEEILENSTVSTVDSDSCLEDRIKAVDEDIAQVANGENEVQTDDNDDIDGFDRADGEEDKDYVRWNEEIERADTILTTTAIIHEDLSLKKENIRSDATSVINDPNSNEVKNNCKKNIEEIRNEEILLTDGKNILTEKRNNKSSNSFTVINSKESIDPTIFVVRSRDSDGYANLIKEFAMEAGSSKVKKEEKQKKKLGFRRLLPAIFSPKDSRKDYKKKEQKERRRYDERHFARYQQNGNYTRSPDTMNLNEDIKRNVKLDNSLNGSIIEERLDEIKRELFPEQGPITSTPDHFLQTDDTRLLRERTRGSREPRSYTANSSLSSIAPDDRWLERSGQFGISPDIRKYEQRQRREQHDSRRYGHLERKHSLQESNQGARTYLFQRNHGASGRISAPPGERYYIRSRAIHPVDRPLPEIPQSRLELSNYENYQDDVDQLRENLSSLDVTDNVSYRNQSGLYQNDRNLEASLIHSPPQSVPAQVKITRQPIVNQNQKAPLVGRTPKYPSSGSSQKSGDYADSSCTPNSSQKSEFSPSSSKSGEYYLNSPRSSARASPADRPLFEDARDRIYENEGQTVSEPSNNYIGEHLYDETPSSPCHDEHFAEISNCIMQNSPEKKDDFEQKCSSNQQSPSKNCSFQYCEDNENTRMESKREIEKSREDCLKSYETTDISLKSDSLASNSAERSSIQNVSSSKLGVTVATSPVGFRVRRSQPDDQILIASPKRDVIFQSRISRPSNEARLCDAESPVPIADSRGISGIVPIEVRNQYGGQISPATEMRKSMGQRSALSCGFSKSISRPEPIYGQRGQLSPSRSNVVVSETREGHENDQLPPPDPYGSIKPCRDVDEKIARVQGRNSTSQSPQSCVSETKQVLNEPGKKVARSPIREPSNAAQDICQQRRPDAIQQQQAPLTAAAFTLEGRQSSPTTSQDKMYVSANSLQREPIYEQRQRQHQPQQPRQGQELYAQRITDATCGQQNPNCGLLSPSKQETRQHLEAFYWQQKALEAHRKSAISSANSGPRQIAPKIDLPEMREAVYWQQLKRLDEEQQRRIYEQNLMEDGLYETHHKTRNGSPMISPALPNQTFNSNALGSVIHRDGSYWNNAQQRLKVSPTGKPLLMQVQKGQNQPVLIVRPQQALRDRQELSMKVINPRDLAGYDAQRSKSASPHFHRGDIERTSVHMTCRKSVADGRTGTASPVRKPEVGGVYEEDGTDGDVRPRPHPIFKRGSLIGGDSVEYGSTGPKRVSFSNQPNAGPDLAAGNWPTKRGTAPEPPTRRHRNEDSTSDTDSVFLHQDRHEGTQDVSYVARTVGPSPRCRSDGSCSEQEYDANKPLPPLPKDSLIISRRGNNAKNYACNDARWNSEEQRGCRRKQNDLNVRCLELRVMPTHPGLITETKQRSSCLAY
ncbi:hypothetical protein G5I_12859 [Acromyrmex echinatior]|uniref:Uncharacterized protein n=1 Tax=Acromyrmex echinatior TaxID=103372 RepID=F4X3H6_ACREC|nr:hypothetical protein G5I_12859 [Acromyrmex echinatior]